MGHRTAGEVISAGSGAGYTQTGKPRRKILHWAPVAQLPQTPTLNLQKQTESFRRPGKSLCN